MRIALTALALVAAVPAKAESVDRWRLYIAEAAARFGVPAQWIERVMRAESGGRTMLNGRPITSHAGAMGLMQIMPRTWADMRPRPGLGNDPQAPRDKHLVGNYYIRPMFSCLGYPRILGALNCGTAGQTV